MKYAFNNNGVLYDVVMTHPSILFPQSYADQFIEVPDEAISGWFWDGETVSEPPVLAPIPVPPPTKEELLAQLQALQVQIEALGETPA